MNLKVLFLGAAAVAIGMNSYAQDRIYKKNGDVIEGKVKEVGPRTITYKRADNSKGPDYTINKSDLERVEYENGSEDAFDDRRGRFRDEDDDNREIRGGSRHDRHGKKKIAYAANLVTFSPANITENGFGIGLSYEHNFGKRGFVSLYVPMNLTFGEASDIYVPGGNSGSSWTSYTNFNFMIGPKIYPSGSKGKVKYSIAPLLSITSGQRPAQYDTYLNNYYYYYNYPTGNVENFQFGGMLMHSLNMNPGKHLYIGMDFGWGFTFVNQLNNMDQDTREMVQFSFRLGYRF
jgi:hypothetical protein